MGYNDLEVLFNKETLYIYSLQLTGFELWGKRGCTQGLTLSKQVFFLLSCTSSPFYSILEMVFHELFAQAGFKP
jgi:hypothetical protein